MQITENLRKDILYALPKLSRKDLLAVAAKCDVHPATVSRLYRKLRLAEPVEHGPLVVALAELAAKRKPEVVKEEKKLKALEKQLSKVA